MKFSFYPGCVSRGGCPELYPAAIQVCAKLGFDLEEIKGASCTGAGVLQEKNQFLGDVLNARTFAMAEAMGLPNILLLCSTCQGVMSQANYRLKANAEYLAKVNNYLAEEGLTYKGTANPRHLLWVIAEDYGIDNLKKLVTHPLKGLKVAPFYGCYIVRPTYALGTKENPHRETALEDVIAAVGGEPVDFPGKSRCCGFPILLINERNSVKMVAKHTGDAKDLGADAMVTPCPLCHLNLDGFQPKAQKAAGKDINLPIIHLPQMIGLAMGMSVKEMGLQRHIVSTKSFAAKVSISA